MTDKKTDNRKEQGGDGARRLRRVSTQDQNPDLQRDALAAAGCARVFEDEASGARADRPGLAQALGYMRDGDVLVVWKLDRLGRSLSHLIETVAGLQERGVGFRSITEAIDTTTPVFHLFGALGEFERDLIRERTRAGRDTRAGRTRPCHDRPRPTVREAAARLKIGKTALYAAMREAPEPAPAATDMGAAR